MLPRVPADPEAEKRRVLARVYDLLIRLADEYERKTVDSGNLGGETLSTADGKDSGEESSHE